MVLENKENRRSENNKRQRKVQDQLLLTPHPHKEPFDTGDQKTPKSCTRCGKASSKKKNISLLHPEKTPSSSRKCRSRCKHKEELARYTNVSVTTAGDTTSDDGEISVTSTICTQITERSIRSIVRETTANKEILRLQDLNNQLTSQLDALAKGSISIRDLCVTNGGSPPEKLPRTEEDSNTSALDITLQDDLDATIKELSPEFKQIRTSERPKSRNGALSPVLEPPRTPKVKHLEEQRSAPRSEKKKGREEARVKSPDLKSTRENGPDSGYDSVRIIRASTRQLNSELLHDLEEENEVLRSELKSSVNATKELMELESEIRRLRNESEMYQEELLRLRGVDEKLTQVESFYHKEKKTFRVTIEDTLITLEDFRKDKEELQRETVRLGEALKDSHAKNKTLKDELQEQGTLLTNNQEKLKLELETRQSENGMLQSRIDTVEENCHFLEGQVQALERENCEKNQIITAAEQHALDMDRQIGELRKENAVLQGAEHQLQGLKNEVEELKGQIESMKNEREAAFSKVEKTEEQNGQLHQRLAELVKSHTLSEESLQCRERQLSQMKSELETLKGNSRTLEDKAMTAESRATQLEGRYEGENEKLRTALAEAKEEIAFIEEAFFKGWTDGPDTDSSPGRAVKFQEDGARVAQFPKAEKIIQTIKLDRQKLKAKLVRCMQDTKTIQSQLQEKEDTFHNENTSLAKRLREALDRLEESEVKGHVLERTAKNLSIQVEEMGVVNRSLELENYHLKKMSETLGERTPSVNIG